jgi:putative peptide zinc metalloprotease protein
MATAEAFRSSTTRPVGLRRRGDLVTIRQVYQGQVWWVVKDPIALAYFRFRPEEFALLEMLDGQKSLEDLQEAFEAEFPPRRITLEEVSRFVSMLHRSGLVIGDRPGQGPQLFERRNQRIWKQWMAWLSNVMALRFRGIDPDQILNRLDPWLGCLFSWPALTAAMFLVTSAGLLVTINFAEFRSKLPEFQQFFAAGNWIWLAVALGVTKVIHEFGHGISCKRFGGECHEMGVMFLVFTPCLYCDVSDSWMLPDKWKRAAIGAAGIYVEVIIASIATFLWWNSHEGLFNQLCLDVMFVSSVSTILFNANPLLRYDGYYILSDVLEIPNLRQKATSILGRTASRLCLGIEQPEDPFLPQRKRELFALYAVASSAYGWLITASIFFFVWKVLEPYRLEVLGRALAMAALWGLVVRPSLSIWRFLKVPGRRDQVKAFNLMVTVAVVATLIAAIALIPLPQRVWCGAELRPDEAETVYVTEEGRLDDLLVRAGDRVEAGQVLARLSNVDLDLEIADLEGQAAQFRTRLQSLQRERFTDSAAGLELGTVEESLASVEEQLAKKLTDREKLVLTAPKAGVVLPGDSIPQRDDPSGRLPEWHGLPLDKQNLGGTFREGTTFCLIGDPDQLEAVMLVDESEVEFVEEGQPVALKLDALSWLTIRGTIDQIAENRVDLMSPRLSVKSGGSVPTVTDASGRERPISAHYEASMVLPVDEAARLAIQPGTFTPGMRGTARIEVGDRTIGQWLLRLLWQTFNFRL